MVKRLIAAIALLTTRTVLKAWSFTLLSETERSSRGATSFRSSELSSLLSSTRKDSDMTTEEKAILVVGCCGLDRLLTVSSYPRADAKVLTKAYHEIGGGNAANTACAMALLSNASFLEKQNIRVKLMTKVGDDYIGQQLKDELQKSGVDVNMMFMGERGSTSGFTSVIVSEEEHTRTCIHTPGTCGALTTSDLASTSMDDLFANVVHVHSDSRFADVSLLLANEAHQRDIPVTVDAEKDRHTKSFDLLLETADVIFTNSTQLNSYLERRTKELEAQHQRQQLAEPVISTIGGETRMLEDCTNGIIPLHFYQRWFGTRSKETVITKGEMGALHVCCQSSSIKETEGSSISHEVIASIDSATEKIVYVEQRVTESDASKTWNAEYSYKLHRAGVLPDAHIVDTTGAGDAFIGAYILTRTLTDALSDPIQFGLEFGAWVGGKKLSGPGARSALPRGSDVDEELGRTADEVEDRLGSLLGPFSALPTATQP